MSRVMAFHKKKSNKQLQFSHHNSRIDFASLIFEASKQGDADGLELILAQKGAVHYINTAGRDGMTPLTTAAKNGDLRCVKILLANKSNIYLKGSLNGKEKYAWEIAEYFGHAQIAGYINACVDDLVKYSNYHRAMMEADVLEICKSKVLRQGDLHEFDKHMERLKEMDTFSLNGDEQMPSLLVLAAEADNKIIVERLIEKYDATPFANNQQGETALHIACRKKSDLRYYLTKGTPELLFAVNVEGVQPLHIACENNDVNYFTWIFQNVLEDIERKEGLKTSMDPQLSLSPATLGRPKVLFFQFSQPGTPVLSSCAHVESNEDSGVAGTGRNPIVDRELPLTPPLINGHISPHLLAPDVQRISENGDVENNNHDQSPLSTPTRSTNMWGGDSPKQFQTSRAFVEDSFLFSANTLLESTSSILKQACTDHGNSPLTIQNLLSLHMRLFAVNVYGFSVLHIASKHGFTELLHLILQVAKVLEHNPDGADLNILTRRDTSITPIEQAICSHQPHCLRFLLEFASETPIFKSILDDSMLLAKAVSEGDKETLEVLIECGMFKGLKQAIREAIAHGKHEMLQMLMYYYTQVMCLLRNTSLKSNKQVHLERALVIWEQLDLEEIIPNWFQDATIAVTSVSHLLKVNQYVHPIQDSREAFVKMGRDCTEYFRVHIWQPHAYPKAQKIFHLTDFNLSGNHLQSIPPELFQIETLQTLDLSNNKLRGLPSSLDFQHPFYTCKNLSKLQLSNNLLRTLPEDLFFAVGSSLEELHASDNLLEGLPPGLWICPKLHTLGLARNKLKQLHYFSSRQYYYDEEFSRLLIDGLSVERGVPINSGKIDDEDFMNMMNYITRLNVFYQTVEALLPSVIEEDTKHDSSLLQHVVDIHWLRSKLSSDKRNVSLSCFDVNLPPDEACMLKSLDLSHNQFTDFPWDLACTAPDLEKLDLRGNKIKSVDMIKNLPANIESVIMSDNCVASVSSTHSINPCGSPVKLLSGYLTDPKLVGYCKHTEHCILDKVTNIILNNNDLTEFQCMRKAVQSSKSLQRASSLDASPYQSLYPSLSVLSLDHNNLQAVPEGVHCLTQLSSLSLSHNISITRLPPEMGVMNPQTLLIVKLEGVYPKNINQQLLERPGARGILTYLKMLHQKSMPYHRLKLMIIGNSNVGKTSLLLSLTQKGKVTRFKEVERGVNKIPLSTVGVDLGDWEYQTSKKPKVTFMTWDFGGQEEYYATHQCFLTQRSLYILVWNVEMKEAGLESLRPWLENIGGRVPGAPVVIVGTHVDSIPQQKRAEVLKHFVSVFQRMYLSPEVSLKAYPKIFKKCFFVSSHDGTNMSSFRDELYEFALTIKPPGRRVHDLEPLLKQHVPACYIKLQDIIRDIARRCAKDKKHPVLTTEQIRLAASNGNFLGNSDELEQGIQFLHENGILLHYDDPALSDVYFVDPQWLCSMLSCVVTVHERNPFQKNGFMELSALRLLLENDQFPHSLIKEFVSLMQKFEVVHLLDDSRLLIPSLLPADEGNACVVFPTSAAAVRDKNSVKANAVSKQGFSRLNVHVFARYYILPFIPNGFFPRVLARILGGGISECFTECVSEDERQGLHWRCWRNGIILVSGPMEVLHISPIHLPLANTDETVLISSTGARQVQGKDQSMIQIIVSILPEELVQGKSQFLPSDESRSTNSHLAIWILRKLIEILDSVFDDWYDAFARRNGFDAATVEQASPCSKCLQQTAAHSKGRSATLFTTLTSQLSSYVSSQRTLHMFTSPYCVLAASANSCLPCPVHGPIPVSDVAPDLAFADFSVEKLFYEPEATVKKFQTLGTGGFGSVHSGILEHRNEQKKIAIKEFRGLTGRVEAEGEESFAWDIYLAGSREARMMNYLCHANILELVGLVFHPLRLLLELAPKGDLKNCIKPFKNARVKLNRRILKQLMFQIADAMEYIHSKKIIYRDLKPGNILVWQFPDPKSQWSDDAAVFVKLADYGISKYCTPEGVRGSEGTPAYLPPEVILHGGNASFSTELDVYSFGMLLYYLFTFLGPFETERGRPVSALLEEQKRPELAVGNRPPALQMYELMCWCWSENPNCRPTFTQIKDIIKKVTFTYLFGATPLTTDDDSFTSTCTHTYKPPNFNQPQDSNFTSPSTTPTTTAPSTTPTTAAPSPSVVNMLAASIIEDNSTRVWYGTEKGKLGYMQFLSSETTSEVVINFKHSVTSLCVCGMQIWVGTAGEGIHVYDVLNPKDTMIALWNQGEKVYKLLHVKQSGIVFALTSKGLVIFETSFIKMESVRLISPKNTYSIEPVMITGVVVPPVRGKHDAEVWCVSTTGKLKIFNGSDAKFHGVKQLQISKADHYELHCFEKDGDTKVIISMGNLLQIWNAPLQKTERTPFDCHIACSPIYGMNVEKSRITSLLAVKDTIYIGTRGGMILVYNYQTQEIAHFLQGYSNTVSFLVPISKHHHMRRFSRLYARENMLTSKSVSGSSIVEGTLSSSAERATSERTIVLSFGKEYQGILGNAKNHPRSFFLPVDNSRCSYCLSSSRVKCMCEGYSSDTQATAKPDPKTGYILYWLDEEVSAVTNYSLNSSFNSASGENVSSTSS